MPTEFASPPTLSQPAGYSHIVSFTPGRIVWTAGQVALAAGDATWNDVVRLTFYVADLDGLPVIRAIRDAFVDVERPPTSSLVKVAGLVLPELLIEIEAVACVAD